MVGARSLLRALVATATPALLVPAAVPAPAPATPPTPPTTATVHTVTAAATAASAPEAARTPLEVSIDSFSPAVLPERGNLTIRGTVTNATEEIWTTINLYAIVGDDRAPMRTAAEVAEAVEVPPETDVGARITDLGTRTNVPELAPGDSARFTVVVPRRAITVRRAGVYWFGVHALGESASSPRDGLADGRARTFLPYVPARYDDPVAGAMVLPVARTVSYRPDGAVADAEEWEELLGPRGRLGRVPQVAAAAGDVPLTYALDPSVFDALGRLARGNPARSLGPTVTPDDPDAPPSESPSDPATETPGSEPSEGEDPPGESLGEPETPEQLGADPESPAARAAEAWLADFATTLEGRQVLTLPYGNPDLPAMADHAPDLYGVATRPRPGVLRNLGVEPDPAVMSPNGFLDAASIAMVDDDTTIIASDRMFGRPAPASATIDGHRVLVTTSAVAQGGPGPGPSVTPVGLRQRFLAEAAVRAIDGDDRPVVWTLPRQWDLRDPGALFADLDDVPWLDLGTVDDVADDAPATQVQPDELRYPEAQETAQVSGRNFLAAEQMIRAGERLDRVLTENDQVGEVVTGQALSSVSYAARQNGSAARSSAEQAAVWVEGVLARVRIQAPRGVTLTSSAGSFSATVTNQLDQPVTVSVVGRSDAGLRVVPPEPFTLAPRSRTTVLLETRVTTPRVHDVTLYVTDSEGEPVGPTDELAVRSSQVSAVIWVIMGTGAGLLFLAIAVRLVRRVRSARADARAERAEGRTATA